MSNENKVKPLCIICTSKFILKKKNSKKKINNRTILKVNFKIKNC